MNDLIAYIALGLIALNALGLPLVFLLGRRSRARLDAAASLLAKAEPPVEDTFDPANPLAQMTVCG